MSYTTSQRKQIPSPTMTTTEIIQEIRSYCIANADAERVKKSQRLRKNLSDMG